MGTCDRERLTPSRSYRTSITYPSSGYNLDVPGNLSFNELRAFFQKLQDNGFIDKATRALFLNINLYSENLNAWFVVQLLFEVGLVQESPCSWAPGHVDGVHRDKGGRAGAPFRAQRCVRAFCFVR